MKKLIIFFVCISMSTVVFAGCRRKQQEAQAPQPTQKARREDRNVNQEPVDSRPYVQLLPQADGRALTLSIIEMKKQAEDVEYEIEYSSGSLLQGAFGSIDDLTKFPAQKEVLLGSCSSGGKCTYNKDVTGGTLILRFGNPDFTLKQEWSYNEKARNETVFSSRDGKFTLDTSGGKHTANTLVIYNSPGYPGTVEGTVIAGPYTVAASGSITGTVSVSIRLPLEETTGTILSYDGKAWKEMSTTVTDRVATAKGSVAEVYVVIKK